MVSETGHLGQVAHGRFARVKLPVRVRREADGRVERELGRNADHALRVQRQVRLEPLDAVRDEHAERAEHEKRDRVLDPRLLALRVDAHPAVAEAFGRTEHFRKRLLVALEHAVHENAERLRQRRDEQREDDDLDPSDEGHGVLQNFSGTRSA